MNQERGISFRRHQYSRLKAKRINLHYWGRGYHYTREWCKGSLGIAVNTPKVCSAPQCCGNPRKLEGQSRKERSHVEDLLHDIS